MLAERIRQRRAVTPAKTSVRLVKFTPEEMAYEVPDDTSHFIPVGRGTTFAKPSKELIRWKKQMASTKGYVRLDRDVEEFFRDERTVNETLRRAMELMKIRTNGRKRKSA